MAGAPRPRSPLARAAIAAGLFLLAFAIRCLPFTRVFNAGDVAAGRIHLFGPDALYHMRRVLYGLERFPRTLHFDPYVNFPQGGEPIWSPAFDWLLAAFALPFHRPSDPSRAEWLLVWVPPLLGACTVVALFQTARRVFDDAVALVAAGALCFLSGHYWYSQLGFIDHHAAVALVSTILLALALGLLTSLDTPESPGPRTTRLALATGGAMAALLLLWPGGLLHVGLVEAALVAHFALCHGAARARRSARAAALANAVAALPLLPAAGTWSQWSSFSPAVLSYFQPWLFASLALHASVCALCFGRWPAAIGGRRRRVLLVGATAGALLGTSVLALPDLVVGARDALQWLFKQETFQRAVAESKPLFRSGEGLGVAVAEARLSRFLYLIPLALAALALDAWRRRDPARGLVVAWTLGLGLVTLLQKRFFNSFSVALALVLGWSLVGAWRLCRARAPLPLRGRAAALALVCAAGVWLLFPTFASYRLLLRNFSEAVAGRPISLPPALVRQRALERAARWLRDHSPPTRGFFDAALRPEYGVMAAWSHGHLIEYVARRPSIADNFGDDLGEENFLKSERYFEAGEAEADRILADLGARYVLLRTAAGALREALPRESMRYRLSAPEPRVRGLRLVYDERMPVPGDDSRIRIFLRVEPTPTG